MPGHQEEREPVVICGVEYHVCIAFVRLKDLDVLVPTKLRDSSLPYL